MAAAKTAAVTFTAPACSFGIAPTGATFTKTGGKGSVATTASSTSCKWTAQSNAQWVTLTVTNYTGSAAVKYVRANEVVPPSLPTPWFVAGLVAFVVATLAWARALIGRLRRVPASEP